MHKYLLILSVVLLGCFSCQHPTPVNDSPDTLANTPVKGSVPISADTLDNDSVSSDEATEQPAEEPTKSAIKSSPKNSSRSEKLYVTGYTSNGQVWGYVTMKGDRGSGTIHDSEENHFAVTCTRHGNELYAVDHNSRQYVLKY